jgi:hypothetical protein
VDAAAPSTAAGSGPTASDATATVPTALAETGAGDLWLLWLALALVLLGTGFEGGYRRWSRDTIDRVIDGKLLIRSPRG